jgi:hypothetical protein
MVKKDTVKKTQKNDDVTRFWYTLKKLDPNNQLNKNNIQN